jgi:hypothetical protein
MPTPAGFNNKRRTAPHNGRSNAVKRASEAAKKKRAKNYASFLSAMAFVTPYRKNLERKNLERRTFNNLVNNARSNANYGAIINGGHGRGKPLGLTQQQWYALAGTLMVIHRYPNVNLVNAVKPIGNRVRATGRYTNANRNALLAWARSR